MINVYEIIYSTLIALGYPVREQGSYGEGEELPETFITYQVIYISNRSHADNQPTCGITRVQVNLYSRDPTIKQGADRAIKAAMLPAGFLYVDGRDLPLSADTGHYGFTCDYRFFTMEE